MEKVTTEDVEKLYKEGDEHGVRKVMQDIWITDKEHQRMEFACDQVTHSTSYYNKKSILLITLCRQWWMG